MAARFHYDGGDVATCPHCEAFLDEGHQCKNVWQRRFRLGARIVAAMGLGASVSMFVLFSVTSTPTRPTIAVMALLGVVAGEAVRQALPRHI